MDFFLPNYRFFLYSIFLLVNACATLPKTASEQPNTTAATHELHLAKLGVIKDFSLKGRLGVVTQKQGFSGGIDWQHSLTEDNIDVYSPVGGKVANIHKNLKDVTLTQQDGQSIRAQTAESLTETTLGFRLPLAGLSEWVLGKPTASNIEASSWDESGRLLTLKQDGWDIRYENYADVDGQFLPKKITLKSTPLNLKLVIDTWALANQP